MSKHNSKPFLGSRVVRDLNGWAAQRIVSVFFVWTDVARYSDKYHSGEPKHCEWTPGNEESI